VVQDGLRHANSFWRRLFPRWRALKRQVGAWYIGPVPDTAGLRRDLTELAAYHRRAGYARQVEETYAADLVSAPDGRPDWQVTSGGLKAVERFDKWKLPAELKAAAAPGGGLDRTRLKVLVDKL